MEIPASSSSNNTKSSPPINDCCPICLDDFTLPCRSNCDHWFCASCILEYWHYGGSLKPCKCPFCLTRITSLSPDLTMISYKDSGTASILKNVDKYNSLYVSGASGLIMKVRTLPSVGKRFLLDMSDPARMDYYNCIVRGVAVKFLWQSGAYHFTIFFMSIVYMACSFDFIPKGYLSTPRFFELCSLVFIGSVHLFGILHRCWQRTRTRNLADTFPQ